MTDAAAAETAENTSNVYGFAEETCWDAKGVFKDSRMQVRFRLTTVGKWLGPKLDLEFVSDYGLYYGSSDEHVRAKLKEVAPGYPWDQLVYHCWPDQSRIHLIDPETDRIVAQIATKKYGGKPVVAMRADKGEHGDNVISFAGLIVRRAQRLQAEAQRHAEIVAGYTGDSGGGEEGEE